MNQTLLPQDQVLNLMEKINEKAYKTLMVHKLTLIYEKFDSFYFHIFFSYKCFEKFIQSGPYTLYYELITFAYSLLLFLYWY